MSISRNAPLDDSRRPGNEMFQLRERTFVMVSSLNLSMRPAPESTKYLQVNVPGTVMQASDRHRTCCQDN